MSDEMIRQFLAERKREERKMKRRAETIELIKDAAAWICLAGFGYMMFVGAYIVR